MLFTEEMMKMVINQVDKFDEKSSGYNHMKFKLLELSGPSQVLNIAFKKLQEYYPLKKNEVTYQVNSGVWKDEGVVRYAFNDPDSDKIQIFLESILYGLFDYSLRHKPTDAEERTKLNELLIHTIAHEYHHSIQKEQGVDMKNLTQQHEDDCDRFADDFINKLFP